MGKEMRTVLIATLGMLLINVAFVDDVFAQRIRGVAKYSNGVYGYSAYCVLEPRAVWVGLGIGFQKLWITVCY
jgi:hypothetical protein